MAGPAFPITPMARRSAMKQGYEGIAVGGTMLVIALTIAKWLFS